MKINLKQSAIHYYNLGFNITHIIPQRIINDKSRYEYTLKAPSHPFTTLEYKRQDLNTLMSYNWEEASGVGAVMGYKQLRSIDIDGCNNIDFIHTFLVGIGLPKDYEWVVKTGSGNGFQIIIYAKNHTFEIPKGKVVNFFPNEKFSDFFEHLELRWTNHVVLPPSKHISGKRYKFLSGKTPIDPPRKININLITAFVETICKTQGDTDTQGNYLNNFMSAEYAYKEKISSRATYLYKYYKEPFYFFIDIKANELPNLNMQPYENPETYPEIIQIATLVCDSLGKRISKHDFLITPEGWKIKKEVEDFLKLSDIKKSSESIKLKNYKYPKRTERPYYDRYYNIVYSQSYCLFGIFDRLHAVRFIIGHNLNYNMNCLNALYMRNEKHAGGREFNQLLTLLFSEDKAETIKRVCTMERTVEFCGMKSIGGYKYPELKELYFKVFNEKMDGANDAKNDVFNTAKCYWKLRDMGLILT